MSTVGVVTAAYPNAADSAHGFYIQTPAYDPARDAHPDNSDGLFVYTGSSNTAPFAYPTVGDKVEVLSGRVSESFGLTELTVTNGAFVNNLGATAGTADAVTPGAVLPGTDCTVDGATTDCLSGDALAAARERHESEMFQPASTTPYTVSDSYDGSPWANSPSSNFGEIGVAANSSQPLIIPIEVANPDSQAAAFAARETYNEAHRVTLDDARTVTISTSTALPWLTKTHTVRVGAPITFPAPVVYSYSFGKWYILPQTPVAPGSDGEASIHFGQNRPAAPDDVLGAEGNLKIATFNMLNYFVHSGEEWAADSNPNDFLGADRKCTYYSQVGGQGAAGDGYPGRVTNNDCTWTDSRGVVAPAEPVKGGSPGPRGAAQKCDCVDLTSPFADFERQQAKELLAINAMDADVMSLEEVENPIKLGYGGAKPTAADRDAAVAHLVDELNEAWRVDHGEDTVVRPALGLRRTPSARGAADDQRSRTRSVRRSSTTREPSSPSGARRSWSTSRAVPQRPRAAGPGVQAGRRQP